MTIYSLIMVLFTDEKKKSIKHNMIMILSVKKNSDGLSINHIRWLLEKNGITIRWETVKRYLDKLVDEGLLTLFKVSTIYCYSLKDTE